LKQCGLMDDTYIAQKHSDDHVAVPVNQQFISIFSSHSNRRHVFKDIEFHLSSVRLQKKHRVCRSRGDMLSAVRSMAVDRSLWHDDLESDLPQAWEKHGDMLLLPSNCFLLDIWKLFGELYVISSIY